MQDVHSRLLIASVLGIVVTVLVVATKMLPGAHPLTFLLPFLACIGGWWLLYSWRQTQGMMDAAPLIQYIMLVIAAYVLFGLLFAANGQIQPLSAAIAVGLFAPAISEGVRDIGKFKSAPEPEGENEDGD